MKAGLPSPWRPQPTMGATQSVSRDTRARAEDEGLWCGTGATHRRLVLFQGGALLAVSIPQQGAQADASIGPQTKTKTRGVRIPGGAGEGRRLLCRCRLRFRHRASISTALKAIGRDRRTIGRRTISRRTGIGRTRRQSARHEKTREWTPRRSTSPSCPAGT
jgi:hypothetical protein